MGTRADFYIGRGEDAEWLGSIAFDGYPEGLTPLLETTHPLYQGSASILHDQGRWPAGKGLLDASTEPEYRERLARFFLYRDDVTLPEQGWPWPWENSGLTDYAYAFDDGKVWNSGFGDCWTTEKDADPDEHKHTDACVRTTFPDMKSRQNVTFGKRSGLIVLGGGPA